MLNVKMNTIEKKSNIKVWILFMFMCFPAFYQWLNLLFGSASLVHLLLVLFTYIPFVYLFVFKKEPFMKTYLYFVFGLLFIFAFYSIININNDFMFESYALPACITLFSGIIGFFIMAIQDDPGKVKRCFKVITIILITYYYLYTFDIENSASYEFGYDMFLGFRMLFPCLFALNFSLVDKNEIKFVERIFWIGIAILSLYVILAYGSRGPILGIFMFFIMKYGTMFLPRKDISVLKKICVSLLVIVLMIIFYSNFTNLLMAFSNYLSDMGISSRTVQRFLSNTATYDNGRYKLFSMVWEKVNVLGYGPFSDQFYFGEGNYAHNFILELLFDFGLFGGALIIIVLVFKFVKILKWSAYSQWYEIFVVLFSYCFGRLIFSGTFWTETNFWLLLGVGYVYLRDAKGKITDEKNKKNILQTKHSWNF